MAALFVTIFFMAHGALASDRQRLLMAAHDILASDRPTYKFGANGEGGRYDCSSFLVEAARRGGVGNLPRTSRDQFDFLHDHGMVWTKGQRGWGRLIPGDLVFYSGTYSHGNKNPISHVMIYAGGGKVVGAQNSGVGYHKFTPKAPLGDPGRDDKNIRSKKTIYAYARPDWGAIRMAERRGGGGGRIARQHSANAADWERVRWSGQVSGARTASASDGGWESGWHFSGEARASTRTIRPARGKIDEIPAPGERGVWLP